MEFLKDWKFGSDNGPTLDAFTDWVEEGWTRKVSTEQDEVRELAVMALGLSGEIGEVVGEIVVHGSHVTERIKKEIRGDGKLDKTKLTLELGDVQHYLCRIARHYGITMHEILVANIEKIEARRGKRAWETK